MMRVDQLFAVAPLFAQAAEAVEETGPPIRDLSPEDQLRVIMGLFVIIFLGIFLYLIIKAGSHMVRGMSAPANRLPPNSLPADDDWTKKPLNEQWSDDGDNDVDNPLSQREAGDEPQSEG